MQYCISTLILGHHQPVDFSWLTLMEEPMRDLSINLLTLAS
ncbi:hypothetical protein AM1_D0062 (plasmid) [Acaryochloris marina MBIC11017]|uniref:Uncharacterized protein n=1 Tax=Acaryochloris marina (strain MBIC 11017) TaxID=329726 RepID=A8ZNH1_ACAM1|nr:hypothetical protein AM1_D0062 [Acaryochloris marina MBIC11017]